MTRRTRTRTGARLWILLGLAASGAVLLLPVLMAAAEPQAVVAGTVFRDPGFALPRAEVTLALQPTPDAARKKFKPRKTMSDARGEFAFYVPPEKATYLLTVKAEGLEPQEKAVVLSGGPERIDTYFTLKPASPPPGQK